MCTVGYVTQLGHIEPEYRMIAYIQLLSYSLNSFGHELVSGGGGGSNCMSIMMKRTN
jgi:hypothetical protein